VPNKFGALDPNRENLFDFRSPVLPIGVPENIFVSNSVRLSQNQAAQNSPMGLFNVDTPTASELNDFTYDLKGLSPGMDSNLFVSRAVHHKTLVPQQNLFVQNAVLQSQLESTARNIGATSYNSATEGVSSLFSPFDLGAPAPVVALANEIQMQEKTVNTPKANNIEQNIDKKTGKECLPKMAKNIDFDHQKPSFSNKLYSQKPKPALGFSKQLTHAAKHLKTNRFCDKH
jgi:hypothetical protein